MKKYSIAIFILLTSTLKPMEKPDIEQELKEAMALEKELKDLEYELDQLETEREIEKIWKADINPAEELIQQDKNQKQFIETILAQYQQLLQEIEKGLQDKTISSQDIIFKYAQTLQFLKELVKILPSLTPGNLLSVQEHLKNLNNIYNDLALYTIYQERFINPIAKTGSFALKGERANAKIFFQKIREKMDLIKIILSYK